MQRVWAPTARYWFPGTSSEEQALEATPSPDMPIADIIEALESLAARSAFAGTVLVPARPARTIILAGLNPGSDSAADQALRTALTGLARRSLVAPAEIAELCDTLRSAAATVVVGAG